MVDRLGQEEEGGRQSPSVYPSADRGGTPDWVRIQESTFTNWCNEWLKKKTTRTIKQLDEDLQDGVLLLQLLEALSKHSFGRYNHQPRLKQQKLENLTAALKFVKSEGIKLVNIGNEDIFNGELKLILGLLWALILRYHISRRHSLRPEGLPEVGGLNVKQAMRTWLQEVLPPNVNATGLNFTRDWNDGTLLLHLIEALQPGAVGDDTANIEDPLERCRYALLLAEKKLGIPQLMHAADLANPAVDELSLLTYLSYFADCDEVDDSADTEGLLAWAREKLPNVGISNFDTDWHNGIALCALVNELSPGACPDWKDLDPDNGEENFQLAIEMARESLDVDLEETAEKLIQSSEDSRLSFLPLVAELRVAGQEVEDCRQCAALGSGLLEGQVGKRAEFAIRHEVTSEQIDVEIVSPTKGPIEGQLVEDSEKGILSVHYTPTEPGEFDVNILCHGRHIQSSPFKVAVEGGANPSLCHVEGSGLCIARPNVEQEFLFDARQGGSGQPTVLLQNLLSSPATITPEADQPGLFKVRYTPLETGSLLVVALWDSEPISGSPFTVPVIDPEQCLAEGEGLRTVCVGQKTVFTVDTRKAGPGELKVELSGVKTQDKVAIEASSEDAAILVVEYVAKTVGELSVQLLWSGFPTTDAPFSVVVVNPTYKGSVLLASDHSKMMVGEQVNLAAELIGGSVPSKASNLSAKARGLKSGSVPVVVKADEGCQFQIEMKPQAADEYFIDVLLDGKPIDGSPLRAVFANPCNPDSVVVTGPETGFVTQEVRFSVDSSNAGSGELEVSVTGPAAHGDLTVDVKPGSKPTENYICYTPTAAGRHHLEIKWSGQPVPGSPFPLNVEMPPVDASQVKVHYEEELMAALPLGEPLVMVFDTSDAGIDEFSAMALAEATSQSHDLMVVSQDEDLFTLTFEPPQPGKYQLYIFYGEDQVPGSPFSLTAVTGAGDVELESVRFGDVGEHVLVGLRLADFEKAGSVAVTVIPPDKTESEVVTNVTLTTDGLFVASFLPAMPGPHHFDVLWDGAPIAGGSFDVDVTPGRPPKPEIIKKKDLPKQRSASEGSPRRLRGRGSNIRVLKQLPEKVSIAERVSLTIQAPGVPVAKFSATLTDLAGSTAPVDIVTSSVGLYSINVTPRSSGQHVLNVNVDGQPLPDSPFVFVAAGDGSSPAGSRKAPDASRCTLSHLPQRVFVGKTCHFIVSTHNAGIGELKVTVGSGPFRQTDISISKPRAHVFSVQLAPWLPGNVSLNVMWGGQAVPGSPVCISFIDCTPDANKCHANVESPLQIATNRFQRVLVNTEGAGRGNLAAVLRSKGFETPVLIERQARFLYRCAFVIQQSGTYSLVIKWGGEHIPGSPFKVISMQKRHPEKVRTTGGGVKSAKVGEKATFIIDTTEGGLGVLSMKVLGPNGQKLEAQLKQAPENKRHVQATYTPAIAGKHQVIVKWSKVEVPGSPFMVPVV